MKLFAILALVGAGSAVQWEPTYQRVSPSKARVAYLSGRDPELEPLETGTMKTLEEKHALTKGIMDNVLQFSPSFDGLESIPILSNMIDFLYNFIEDFLFYKYDLIFVSLF